MATTAIWSVKGWLGKVVVYVENPDKTENPAYFEKQGMTELQTQGLSDVIDYAAQSRKTALTDESAVITRQFVTGIGCQPETARDEMMAAKIHYGKDKGIVAFHGYQSFAPTDRVTPEMAHEIGVKLAKKLWGEKFQVIVATHLDRANHIHNHFVINSVSHVDGSRYNDCTDTYMEMRRASDALCREYRLSVIEEPKRGKSKHYAEWNAEREGKPTWRAMVKSDVDAAIRQSMTERQFFENLKSAGYSVKIGKDISVKPPGKERFVRLQRNFGEDYAIEGIRRRILAQSRPERIIIPPDPPPIKARLIGSIHTTHKVRGLRALYYYYLFRMGALPKRRTPNPKQVYFLFREDVRHLRAMTQEIRLMAKHGIDTAEQLAAHKETAAAQIIELSGNRKHLRNQSRSIKDEGKLAVVKAEISRLSEQITALRREVRLCEDIESRSVEMKDKLHRAREAEQLEKSKAREMNRDEPFRRRR